MKDFLLLGQRPSGEYETIHHLRMKNRSEVQKYYRRQISYGIPKGFVRLIVVEPVKMVK